jgi:non-specific serine/threonine protein kinase
VLPRPPTSFVGREHELAEARDLLAGTRLLTLTGPGGCGKTRLAIELAGRVQDDFRHGVSFVSLASVRDPALVPVTIAGGIGLQDARGTALLEHVRAYLAQRDVLMVLDNLEQVVAAGGFLGDLLGATDGLRILATSRTPLHLSWEQVFPVPPLRTSRQLPGVDATRGGESEAVRLFVARATASVPSFTVTEEDAAAIGAIAERLDGLPLAIELAAARVKVLPPAAILRRLERSLGLLVSDHHDVPDRQRTLRATIAWSYDLLSEPARRLLATCSVFRGGIDLAMLEEVCAGVDTDAPILEQLGELVDHSLVRRSDPVAAAAPRFTVLETVREFAAEQLDGLPERELLRRAHALACWHRVEHLPRPPAGPDGSGLSLLELEHDNFRAALDWSTDSDPAQALRLANRLTGFWSVRGHFSEGRRRLTKLAELAAGDDAERVDALNGAAWLATDQGDREVALALLNTSVVRARGAEDRLREAEGLCYRGRARLVIGDPTGGRADIERAVELQTEMGNTAGLAGALWLSGAAAIFDDEYQVAIDRLERSVELASTIGLVAVKVRALQLLGVARLELGDLDGARAALAVGVPGVADLGDRFAVPIGLTALAGLAVQQRRPRAALRLAGAAAAYERVNRTHRPQKIRTQLEGWLAPVRAKAGAIAERLLDEGRNLGLDEAIALGLEDGAEDPWRGGPSPALTPREREVAALVAGGLTNREIAARLYLSVRTVEVHVDHALTKLGFRTRTQLAAWLHDEGLAGRST